MAQDIVTFLTGLAVLTLMIERFVEKIFGWIPDKLKENGGTKGKKNGGYILTLLVFLIGSIIAYIGSISVLKELFLTDAPKLMASIITGLFITAGPDPLHQAIRLLEEKKDQAKGARRKLDEENR